MSFLLFLVEFLEKWTNELKSGQAVEVLHCGVETHAAAKAHAKAWPNGRLVKPLGYAAV